MFVLLLRTSREVYSKNVVIITDRKCRDQVSDQELGAKQNVTKDVIVPPTGQGVQFMLHSMVNNGPQKCFTKLKLKLSYN